MAIPMDFASPERLGAAAALLGSMAAKASIVILLGAACVLVARTASAATRHRIWSLTLGGARNVPVAAGVLPRLEVRVPRWLPNGAGVVRSTLPDVAVAVGAGAGSRHESVSMSITQAVGGQSITSTRTTTRSTTITPAAGLSADVAPRPVIATTVPIEAPAVSDGASLDAVDLTPRWSLPLAAWLLVAWMVGVAVALLPTIVGLARVAALVRRARPMIGGRWALLAPAAMREMDVRRRVRFLELEGPAMPMTSGVLRPVVLLPAGDFASTIEQRLDVLRHELAHVRRWDCLTQLVARISCAVLWFNPLVWVAARQLRLEREQACDDEVLRAGTKASDYAAYLLRVARDHRMPAGTPVFGALAMARPSQLGTRLRAVLDDRRSRTRVSRRSTLRAAAVATAVVAGVAVIAPAPADAGLTTVSAGTPVAIVLGPNGAIGPSAPGAEPIVDVEASGLVPIPATALEQGPTVDFATAGDAPAPVSAATVAPVIAMTSAAPDCDANARARGKSGSHTNLTGTENGTRKWRVIWTEGDCSFEVEARGEITYNRDLTDVESISSGGLFVLEQHIGDDTRRLSIRPSAGGALERTYTVNGARRDYDEAARAWFAEALIALERQTAFAADQRVPALLAEGGVDAVLRETTLLGADYARRRYYTKLLSLRQLDRAQMRRVVEQAGSQMSSDYELAELLVALAKLETFADDSHPAFVGAAARIESDYERRRALSALLKRDQLAPATVEALLGAAATIDSDYELAELLIDVSKRYAIDERTRATYLKAVASIESDYEHRRVLSAIMAAGGLTPAVTRAMLEDAARIKSDYELAEFLIAISKQGVLDASTREAYFAATDNIESDYEHRRVLMPLLKRDLLTNDIAKRLLASAAKIGSDYECAELLVAFAKAITVDDELRPAFERAADTIESEHDYGRAMGSLRRRVTR